MTNNLSKTSHDDLKQLVQSSKNIVVLTGAGVSTDSGIPDFKTTDEKWDHSISRVEAISISFFQRNPLKFWQLYRELFESKTNVLPNDFHKFVADLENDHNVTVITQNVDGLHSVAGSTKVIEMHGSVKTLICSKNTCKSSYLSEDFTNEKLPKCLKCRKVLKPSVVLFGEDIEGYKSAEEEILNCGLLIVAGTSLDVSPVNHLPIVAEQSAKRPATLWVNRVNPPEQYDFTHEFKGSLKTFVGLFE